MNRKQIQALIAGAVVGVIVTAAMPEKSATPPPPPEIRTLPDGTHVFVFTDGMYTFRNPALILTALVTLGTMFALRTPKTPPPNPQ